MSTIRDEKNKKISKGILDLVANDYCIVNSRDLLTKARVTGNGSRELSEPRHILFYLVKKHTDMTYAEIKNNFHCVTGTSHIYKMVKDTEITLRDKTKLEFYCQVKKIEKSVLQVVADWRRNLAIKIQEHDGQ